LIMLNLTTEKMPTWQETSVESGIGAYVED
jgi:hypothetical protein